ncbi:DUF2254 domain-containing protein [Hoeflea sp. YIM 152468]|uniref:DUF2254 domain-containing protein n=1 Tax=Hoeflea sp. YIM 152468 TaxID=3031759 RepID=UPI0023DBE769|nr:DUF2254 domain-containing protein [Hoeflea sp. YIM 152468]MDF1606919.1 DUF2254 domain-containing protein [Hoeflea sp. YIM 152468]
MKFRAFVTLNGMLGVPAAIAIGLWLLAVPLVWTDTHFTIVGDPLPFWLAISEDTARSLLTTIATAAITTLSMVYSIMLVVFTLAAGNIAPRLLQRFSRDRVNQVTSGLLGGTFLYSLSVLRATGPDLRPELSIAMAFLLAALSVLQVIHFVHSVSRSVTIDAEVVKISEQLERQINALVAETDAQHVDFDEDRLQTSLKAAQSGYVTTLDETALLSLAQHNDTYIAVRVAPGDFVLSGQTLAVVGFGGDDEKSACAVRDAINLQPYRGAVDDIRFSVRILLEIALRALSPGVNDSFTAVTCADRIAAALVKPVSDGLRGDVRSDENGVARLKVPGLSLDDLLNMTLHPLRQAAQGNILMLDHLGVVLNSLYEVAGPDARKLLSSHGKALLQTAGLAQPIRSDLEFLQRRLDFKVED